MDWSLSRLAAEADDWTTFVEFMRLQEAARYQWLMERMLEDMRQLPRGKREAILEEVVRRGMHADDVELVRRKLGLDGSPDAEGREVQGEAR